VGELDGFAALVASLDPAMAIVTTVLGDQRAGCLIGFHAQCSIEPPRYVVWLSKANHTYRVSLLAPRFAVHFLDEADRDLAALFGGSSGDDVDKLSLCDWHPGPQGVPLLDQVPNRVIGTRRAVLDEGSDHVCLVIELDHVDHADRAPPFRPLRLSMVDDIEPGHGAEDRPEPAEERARA